MKLNPFKPGMPYDWLPSKILLIMRLVIIIMITCFMQVSAASFAQRFTYGPKKATLAQVFAEIKKQTGFRVLYSDQKLDDRKIIAVNFKDAELLDVMDLCLKDQELVYELDRETILIKAKEPSFLDRVVAALTDTDISCRVLDADGKALPGASVSVKGKNKKVSADKNGKFVLKGVDEKDILVISYIGYQPLEILVKDAMLQESIVLKEVVGELDEVKLIGYGTTTQRLATGNTSRITAADIEKQPVTNPLQTLQGRMPGVLVTNGQGLPGTETKIQIRGINSIAGNRDPLYIVDGVPFAANVFDKTHSYNPLVSFNNVASGSSITPFNSIVPSDIENIDVLKDADATAIYGARGANGVVLITTKKGKSGTTKLDFNISSALQKVNHFMNGLLSTREYLTLEREGANNDNYPIDQDKDNYPELFLWDQNLTTDWQKLVIGNTGHVTNVNGTISGGNVETTFLLSGNYLKEGVIYPGDLNYIRGGAHLNLNHNSQDRKFFASVSVNYSSDKNALTTGGLPVYNIPNFPLYMDKGQLNFDSGTNYLATLKQRSTTKTDNLIGTSQIGYNITPSLTFKVELGFNRISLTGFNFKPLSSLNPAYNPSNTAQYVNNTSVTSNIEPQLNYIKSIGEGKFQALVGGTYQSSISQGNFIQGENYKDENLFESLGAAGRINTQFSPPKTTYNQYKYASIFGRLNYNLNDKYIINLNYRRDGSSRFGPGKQFGNFGSIGVAWVFSNEVFFKQILSFLSYGKLRTSYGSVGNQPDADYEFLQSYTSLGVYQENPGLIPSRIANPDFRWEVNKKLEASLDLGFLDNRILFSASRFKNRTENQLLAVNLPSQTGFSSYTYNLPAIVENTGIEISLNTENIRNKSFKWSSNINVSFVDNKLIAFPGLESSSYKSIYEIGQPLNIVKGFFFAGVDSQTGNALYYNRNDEKISKPNSLEDYRIIGKGIPDYYGSIKNNFMCKRFEFDFLVVFVKQQGRRPPFSPGLNFGYAYQSYMQEETLQRWQKPGDITNVPKASLITWNSDYTQSSYFWEDASYLKLKNLYLAYLFPTSWSSKAKINQVKVYFQAQNLFTITKYKGSDPEIPNSAIIIPTLRTISLGLQLTI